MRRHGLIEDLAVLLAATVYLVWRSPSVTTYLQSPDLGYQLSLGRLIAQGRVPYADIWIIYGPLTGYASALAIRVHDSLLSEVVLCALGYAAAVTLIGHMARRELGWAAGVLAVLASLLVLARFYKWYYWFFPAAVLFCTRHAFGEEGRARGWALTAGALAGVGSLFRLDLGPLFLLFFYAAAAAQARQAQGRRGALRAALSFHLGLALPVGAWLCFLDVRAGAGSVVDMFSLFFQGSTGLVREWSLPFPRIQATSPLSRSSLFVELLFCMALTYLACVAIALWSCIRQNWTGRERFLLLVGLMGLGLMPQALHRKELAHLLQVVWPVILGAPALLTAIDRLRPPAAGSRRWRRHAVALAPLAVVLAAAADRVRPTDMSPLAKDPLHHWRNLEQGAQAAVRSPVRRLLAGLGGVASGTALLDTTLNPQIYYFARRPMSGRVAGYGPGIFDGASLRALNLESVRNAPPGVVIATSTFDAMPADAPFRRSQPELYAYLRDHYRNVVYQRNGWILLTR